MEKHSRVGFPHQPWLKEVVDYKTQESYTSEQRKSASPKVENLVTGTSPELGSNCCTSRACLLLHYPRPKRKRLSKQTSRRACFNTNYQMRLSAQTIYLETVNSYRLWTELQWSQLPYRPSDSTKYWKDKWLTTKVEFRECSQNNPRLKTYLTTR